MPTIISHPVAAIGLFPWFRRQIGGTAIATLGILLTMAPDIDVIAFRFGIPYEHMFGHRGISHSLAAALLISGLVAAIAARLSRQHPGLLWAYFFFCMASHGLLDMMTSGGRGIAIFAPFTNERYFFEVRPIVVSAIGVADFQTGRWMDVMASELRWIWFPFLGLGLAGIAVQRKLTRRVTTPAPPTPAEYRTARPDAVNVRAWRKP